MRQYGRDKTITGGNSWKRDYHLHSKNHRKLKNWWQEISENSTPRATMKQKLKQEISKENV